MSLMDALLPIEQAEELAQLLELPDSVMQSIAAAAYSIFGGAAEAFETTVKENLPDLYSQVNSYLEPHEHVFAQRLPLTNIWDVLFSVLGYFVLLVGLTVIGKVLGKGSYKFFGMIHNLFLYLLSLYMSMGLLFSARAAGYSLWNNVAGTSEKDYRVAKFVWLFYVSKVPEWIDTVLMLLKHNYHQVSFLHVYHHLSIFVIWWLAAYKAPCGEAYYSAMINSAVHVCMYGYYFLTMLFPTGPVRKLLSNFKFVITKGQMTQFFFNCMQSVYDLLIVPAHELKFSRGLLWLLFGYMLSLLALFGNFMRKNKNRPRVVYSPYASPVGSPVSRANGSDRPNFKSATKDGNGHASSENGNGHATNGDGRGAAAAGAKENDSGHKAGMTKAQIREAEKKQDKKRKRK